MNKKELFDMLVCPKCKGELEKEISDDLMTGSLTCLRCRLRFRIEDGIPNMLIEDAERI